MKILSGTSNQKLSKDISKQLKLKLVNTNIKLPVYTFTQLLAKLSD